MEMQYSLVFIANTGRDDPPMPDYLVEALTRFEKEGVARYKLIAHDICINNGPLRTSSNHLRLQGSGVSVQYALLDMLSKFNPGPYFIY